MLGARGGVRRARPLKLCAAHSLEEEARFCTPSGAVLRQALPRVPRARRALDFSCSFPFVNEGVLPW